MPRKRKLPPLPKMDELGFYYDGRYWRWDKLHEQKVNKMWRYDNYDHSSHSDCWRNDPSYHWRQQVKERKHVVDKT